MRELKGLEIAARSRITFDGGFWLVPSQTTSTKYHVTLTPDGDRCECEDFALTAKACKHVYAARIVRERDYNGASVPIDTTVVPTRPTYPQVWPAYNLAQATEKKRLQVLLADLCRNLPDPPKVKCGQAAHRVRDCIFAMAFKVYCLLSSRRFSCDLLDAHERGHISKPIPGMKVPQFFKNPDFTPILKDLIVKSAAPLAVVETTFATDSSGFSTTRFEKWYDHKHGVTRQKCLWVKTHIACGTKTNVVTAVEILDKDAADSPQFKPLVKTTAQNFAIKEFSADKAYASNENFEAVHDAGGTGYIAFKSNATGGVGGLFEKMFHYFQYRRDEFLKHYHQRSNVESTFSAIKRKFGDSVMSKTDTAMVNEVLCKILCHNLTCLIQEQETLGIVPVFWQDEAEEKADVLPMVKPG
jgi:transposase